MSAAPTPKDTLLRDGTASLYRFRPPAPRQHAAPSLPLLLVPSMINRWNILDLRQGASLADALRHAGLDTWCLDWGVAEDEDRHLTWEMVVERLERAIRAILRKTGAPKVGLLGYCMGATLAGIAAALNPRKVAALINLAGPFDFAHGGALTHATNPAWFDAEAIAAAGNVHPAQMQMGFVAMRPTAQLAKWVNFADRAHDPAFRAAFDALEAWSSDNIPFPAAAYQTYITELYQQNLLVKGQHHVGGRRVDLGAIDCPLLTVVTDRDTICPPLAATALNDLCASTDKATLTIPGGHVGAVVGSRAPTHLYPALAQWLVDRLAQPETPALTHPQEPAALSPSPG